ncbi:MAG: lipid-binding SYLF domain-containing protein [Lysobacterales bacterium]
MSRWLTHLLIAVSLVLVAAAPAHAGRKEQKRAETALSVLKQVQSTPDSEIPASLLSKAYAIAVLPEVVKVGLVVGGRRGKGLISVRQADGTWSNPAYITITGGSFGFQAGVQSADLILVFRTPRGVDNLVSGKFTLGADASVAAGPVGRQASAATDAELKAEILAYARTRGLFAGIALDGSVLGIDYDAIERVYGRDVSPRALFEGRIQGAPGFIVDFRDQLEEQTSR